MSSHKKHMQKPFDDDASDVDISEKESLKDVPVYGPKEAWEEIEKQIEHGISYIPGLNDHTRRVNQTETDNGWKTIRVFVSSTFEDFFHEREILVKEVFPELRVWCNERKLHLIECDLRWGVPSGTSMKTTLELSLDELDRCYEENGYPFFINLTCRRIGEVPKPNCTEKVLLVQNHKLVFGLSVTEMEVIYGAYQSHNPNAFFLQRDHSFLDTFPKEADKVDFEYDCEEAEDKIQIMKDFLCKKFSGYEMSRFLEYKAKYDGKYEKENKVKLKIMDTVQFKEKILQFLKTRVLELYPESQNDASSFVSTMDKLFLLHEGFLSSKLVYHKSEGEDISILGRDGVLRNVMKYINPVHQRDQTNKPLVIYGDSGIGKTHFMAKIVVNIKQILMDIPCIADNQWNIFYHFVGAVPQSTEVVVMLQRLLMQLLDFQEKDVPTDPESVIQSVHSALSNPKTKPIIICIDALNQLDDDKSINWLPRELNKKLTFLKWLPREVNNNVKCVLSVVSDSKHFQLLCDRNPPPKMENLIEIDVLSREKIIQHTLEAYGKRLTKDQMKSLLEKPHSGNPLWLTLAYEELRIHGNEKTLTKKIQDLGDGLTEILNQVLKRIEDTSGVSKILIQATLCCIECSKKGLLETELIDILAAEELLSPEVMSKTKKEQDRREKELRTFFKEKGTRLSSFKWSQVRYLLKRFIRPFGDLQEGRVDFYHKSMSEAVRSRYLLRHNEKEFEKQCHWWHTVLSLYFECSTSANFPEKIMRKVEEYPYHLVQIAGKEKLEIFISDWEIVDLLYNEEYSQTLHSYWNLCGGTDAIYKKYQLKIQNDRKSKTAKDEVARRYVLVGRLLLQAGYPDKAIDFGTKGLDILGDSEEKDRHDVYRLLCDSFVEKYKLEQWKLKEAESERKKRIMPVINSALKYSQFLINILEKSNPAEKSEEEYEKYQIVYGKQLICHSYVYELVMENHGTEELPKEVARQMGLGFAAKAVKIFSDTTKIVNIGYLAEATINMGHLHRGFNYDIQIKQLLKAQKLCEEAYGRLHMLMGRIWKNIGIAYEDNEKNKQCPGPDKNYKPAYDAFIQAHKVNYIIFGPEHPKTLAALRDIQSEPYLTIFGKKTFTY